MDDTMSSYSFSHQFYQRWTCAPEPIRAAITQELKDITTLLQTEIPFESFVFSTHDLDAHIDELYENHEAEQAIAKAIADKQEKARATAEKERLEEEQKIKAAEDAKLKEEAKLKEAAESVQKQQQSNERLAADKNNVDNKVTATELSQTNTESNTANNAIKDSSENIAAEKPDAAKNDEVTDSLIKNTNGIKNDNSIKAINDKASTAIKLALKDAKLSATHEELIRELEMQIDDYLSEQMMLMSENLKSWLRAEVTQHLSEDKVVTNKESQKH